VSEPEWVAELDVLVDTEEDVTTGEVPEVVLLEEVEEEELLPPCVDVVDVLVVVPLPEPLAKYTPTPAITMITIMTTTSATRLIPL
jgi:hypothetical protein